MRIAVLILATFYVAACTPVDHTPPDTSAIEAEPLVFGEEAKPEQAKRLDQLDQLKAVQLQRFFGRAANCHPHTAAGKAIMNQEVGGINEYGEMPHCIDRDEVASDDPTYGPLPKTVGEAIKQQVRIEAAVPDSLSSVDRSLTCVTEIGKRTCGMPGAHELGTGRVWGQNGYE